MNQKSAFFSKFTPGINNLSAVIKKHKYQNVQITVKTLCMHREWKIIIYVVSILITDATYPVYKFISNVYQRK